MSFQERRWLHLGPSPAVLVSSGPDKNAMHTHIEHVSIGAQRERGSVGWLVQPGAAYGDDQENLEGEED
jgi:hypothetical protein